MDNRVVKNIKSKQNNNSKSTSKVDNGSKATRNVQTKSANQTKTQIKDTNKTKNNHQVKNDNKVKNTSQTKVTPQVKDISHNKNLKDSNKKTSQVNDNNQTENTKQKNSNKIVTYIFIGLIVFFLIASMGSSGVTIYRNLIVQKLDYRESIVKIDNPDQGFYQFMSVKFSDDGIKTASNGNAQLHHLRCDISAYSDNATANPNRYGSKPLSQKSLDGFEKLLSDLNSKNKSALIRFCYDYNYEGEKDQEPSLEIMLTHIEQFCCVINKFQNTVTGIEVGMVGPWGEMHSSKVALGELGKTTVNALIDKFLDCTDNLPILVRTPNRIYDYLGITRNDIQSFEIPETSKAYHRLGMFNDGYLGSNSDLGTYVNREKEVAFMSKLNEFLPYGGEVTIPNNNPLHDIDKCLPEMFQIHLSYLNISWHYDVIKKWKNSTYTRACGGDSVYYGSSAFTYIENHMGYRFVLRKSILKTTDNYEKLNIELDIDNVGFGNLLKKKKTKILFVKDGTVAYESQTEDFDKAGKIKYSVPMELENGEYEVYIRLYGEEDEGVARYCVQFANNLWNKDLSANLIGKIKVNK